MRRLSALCVAAILVMAGCDDDASYAYIHGNSADGGGGGGHSDPLPNECENACTPGEKKCQDNTSMACQDADGDDCYEWVSKDCDEDELCSDGVCTKKIDPPSGCQNECTTGDKKCQDNTSMACLDTNSDGCYEWVPQNCNEDEQCLDGVCSKITEPPSGCQSTCTPGDKICQDNTSMACLDTNSDGCYEWVPQNCNAGEQCLNGVCSNTSDPPPTCTNECNTANAKTCAQENGKEGFKLCSNFNDDVCLEWSSFVECPQGQKCTDGTCGGCTSECTTNGAAECSGNGFRTCGDSNGDGCYEWSAVTECANGCDKGHCACAHACDSGKKECSGDGYRTCTTDSTGCRVWSAVTKCDHGCDKGECKAAPKNEPTRYPGDSILSPVTPYVVQSMKNIAAKGGSMKNNVFIKVGDSHMDSSAGCGAVFMVCYSNSKSTKPNLNGATFLQSAINDFQSSTDSYNRESKSAKLGKTAYWANGGPLETEINELSPRFAFYGYGSNDIGWFDYKRPTGTSDTGYFATLQWYYREVKKGMNTMMNKGVIPLLIGTGIRTDKPASGGLNPIYFVPVFDAVARGLAEQYQVPYMNLQLAQQKLKDINYGLSGDNLHHSSSNGGCDFSDAGMKKGANMRNRYALEMLDRAWKPMYKGVDASDAVVLYMGSGTKSDPYIIDSIPYTHGNNSNKGTNVITQYAGNCTNTNEGGPEIYYKLELTRNTKIRAFALSSSNVDVDMHLLKSTNASGCLARGDKWVEGNLSAGTYYLVVDTYKNNDNAGEYLFGIVECLGDDPLCGASNVGG